MSSPPCLLGVGNSTTLVGKVLNLRLVFHLYNRDGEMILTRKHLI